MTYHDGIDPPRQTDIFGGERFRYHGGHIWGEYDNDGHLVRLHASSRKAEKELANTTVDQLGLCTRDPACTADPDQHQDGCPVEERLREDLGF